MSTVPPANRGWGDPNHDWQGAQCSSLATYLKKIPLPLQDWLADWETAAFPIPSYQDGWMRILPTQLQIVDFQSLNLRPVELGSWLVGRLQPFASVEFINLSLIEPHLLLRLAYKLLPSISNQEGSHSQGVYAALAAFGIAVLGINMFFCKLCFRRVTGNMSCCDLHSQAKFILRRGNISSSHQAVHARLARNVVRKTLVDFRPSRFQPYGNDIELCEFELTIGSILWQLEGFLRDGWLEKIKFALNQAPLVRCRLPIDFETLMHHEQLEALQCAIDSREWLLHRWPALILIWQSWLEAEAKISPGKNPKGLIQRNLVRHNFALEKLQHGWTHSSISDALGISRSHLSHLLRRGRSGHPE